MARDNYRKVKLIKLLELLRQHTDEQHPMTTNQICAAMDDMGIPWDLRIITQDVFALNELGYEIMATMIGHENAYYVEDRSFSLPELKNPDRRSAWLQKDNSPIALRQSVGKTHLC